VLVRLTNRNEAPACGVDGGARFLWENATNRALVGAPLGATDPEEALLAASFPPGGAPVIVTPPPCRHLLPRRTAAVASLYAATPNFVLT